MAEVRFATAITCMDGRVQEPVSTWIRREFGVDFVDTITEAGPDRILSEGPIENIHSVHKRAGISVDGHGSRVIVVVAHHDCAGNPVSKERHLEHLADAIKRVRTWNLPARLLGVWVNEDWAVEVISDTN